MKMVEINGIKMEIDERTARTIDSYKVGDNVKVLVKKYESYKSFPGVIIGFDNFAKLPTIVVVYLDAEYGEFKIQVANINASTEGIELCPMVGDQLPFEKETVIEKFNRNIEKAEAALRDAKAQKAYFEQMFAAYFVK